MQRPPVNELAPEFTPVNKFPVVDKTSPIVRIDGRLAVTVEEAFRLMRNPAPGLYPPKKEEFQS